MDINKNREFLNFLLDRFKIERKRFDRSGVYAYTQRLLAYNSNKIEGSTLTEEQTALLEKEQEVSREKCEYFYEETYEEL